MREAVGRGGSGQGRGGRQGGETAGRGRPRAGEARGQGAKLAPAEGRGPLQPPGWRRARGGAVAGPRPRQEGKARPETRIVPGRLGASPPLHLLGPEESEPTLDLPQQWDRGRTTRVHWGLHLVLGFISRQRREGVFPHLHVGLRGPEEPLQALARWGLGGGHGVSSWLGRQHQGRTLRLQAQWQRGVQPCRQAQPSYKPRGQGRSAKRGGGAHLHRGEHRGSRPRSTVRSLLDQGQL